METEESGNFLKLLVSVALSTVCLAAVSILGKVSALLFLVSFKQIDFIDFKDAIQFIFVINIRACVKKNILSIYWTGLRWWWWLTNGIGLHFG
jgi:hypothetical protein